MPTKHYVYVVEKSEKQNRFSLSVLQLFRQHGQDVHCWQNVMLCFDFSVPHMTHIRGTETHCWTIAN